MCTGSIKLSFLETTTLATCSLEKALSISNNKYPNVHPFSALTTFLATTKLAPRFIDTDGQQYVDAFVYNHVTKHVILKFT